MPSRGRIFILSGASGCGKSTLLSSLLKHSEAAHLSLEKVSKYSNRTRRENDPHDDIIHEPEITSQKFDFAYFLNRTTYAIKTAEIEERLETGKNLLVILSDFLVVERLKKRFPKETIAIYISSAIDPTKLGEIQQGRRNFLPDQSQQEQLRESFARLQSGARLGLWERVYKDAVGFSDVWKQFMPETDITRIRQDNIRSFHTRYIDNIALFNHVVLNYAEGKPQDMVRQALSIIRYYSKGSMRCVAHPPVFVICAASGMGKGILMELVNLIGGKTVKVVTKWALREPKENDKRDGMIALGVNGKFPSECNVSWTFHRGTPYGICRESVAQGIKSGIAQLFTSNMGQIENLRNEFGQHVSFVYLHRTATRKDIKTDIEAFQKRIHKNDPKEAEIRLNEIEEVYQDYFQKIAEFDHVLLNTNFEEDLFNQMLRLIDFHSKPA